MASKLISPEKTAFLKFDIIGEDSRRKKAALQEISRLYRTGYQLNSESRNDFEKTINGSLLVAGEDHKVVRWYLNTLAQLGRMGISDKYVELALKQYAGNPEITAAGVAALARLHQGNIDGIQILGTVDPAIKLLAALQNTDPRKLDLSKLKINIDTADPEVLKLALITVGLNRDVQNLFHPHHDNGQIVKALGQYPDPIVVQYSIWCVLENRLLSLADLGVPIRSIESQPTNVQSKLLQLVAEKEVEYRLRHEMIELGTCLPALEARFGLAKGLANSYYEGLEELTIPWFSIERDIGTKELIAEHFGRFSSDCGPYEDEALRISEVEPNLRRRLLLGAEGKRLYGVIKGDNIRDGTPDLFGNDNSQIVSRLRQGNILAEKGNKLKKVLVLSANPKNAKSLRLDEEARDLKEKLKLVSNPKVDVLVINEWAVRMDQIQDAILNEKPNILHFSGHGNEGLVCFEDKNGESAPVSAFAIAEMMRLNSDCIECLVLNSCYSSDVANLSAPHLKAVIGCNSTIDDDAAIAFSRAFYRAIANGKSYKESFEFGVNEVRISGADSEADKYTFGGI